MAKIKLTKSAVDAAQPQAKAIELRDTSGAWLPVQDHPGGPQGVHAPVPHGMPASAASLPWASTGN